jgi:hypothetical protein
LRRMLARCWCTVCSLNIRRRAVPELLSPCATSPRLDSQSHQKSQNGLFTMARAISGTPCRPAWASSLNAKCSAAIDCAASRVCGGLLTSSRMSAKHPAQHPGSSRAPSCPRSRADYRTCERASSVLHHDRPWQFRPVTMSRQLG